MASFDLDITVQINSTHGQIAIVAMNLEPKAAMVAALKTMGNLLVDLAIIILNLLIGWTDRIPTFINQVEDLIVRTENAVTHYYHYRISIPVPIPRAILYLLTPEIGIRAI